MKKLFDFIILLCNQTGIVKVNLACDWIWYQDKEDINLQKYKKH